MGVGISIALDRPVAGFAPDEFAGHALNQARWELSEVAEAAGLSPLDEFVSLSPEETEILAADLNFDADADAVTPAGWFRAQDGLDLIRALRAGLDADPEAFPAPAALRSELAQLEEMLAAATEARARFRFSVAY